MAKVAEMGWTATVIPEEFGGLGGVLSRVSGDCGRTRSCRSTDPFSSSVYLLLALLAVGSRTKRKMAALLASGDHRLLRWPKATDVRP